MGILQWELGFKLQNVYFKFESLLIFFVWSKIAQGSLGLPVLASESVLSSHWGVCKGFFRGLFGPSVTPVTQPAAHIEFQKTYGKFILMLKKIHHGLPWPPHFYDFHILTDSPKKPKLNIIHCCQLQ